MKVLKPIDTPQAVAVYIRNESLTGYKVFIKEKETEAQTEITPDSVVYDADQGELTITFSYDFNPRRYYVLEVQASGGLVLNRTMIYTTAETVLQPYRPTEEQFTTPVKEKRTYKVKE